MRNLMALLRSLPDADVAGERDVMCLTITADSRTVVPGALFVAVRGERFDGHTAIAAAAAAGAVVVVVDRPAMEERPPSVTVVRVADSRQAWARLLHAYHDFPAAGIRTYGVTGTNGKTTCATVFEQMLAAAGRPVAFIGTTGIRYDGQDRPATHTTPDAAALCTIYRDLHAHRVDTAVMEVSSQALHQHRVEGIEFQGAVFTNLTHDHLDYHHTMEAYAESKRMLFRQLRPEAVAVVNGDDLWHRTMIDGCRARRVITVGEGEHNRVQIDDVVLTTGGSTFTMTLPPVKRGGIPEVVDVVTPMIGRFNVMNVALCATLAMQEGFDYRQVLQALATIQGPAGRMERILLHTGAVAVVDYAHTPDALEKACIVLRSLLPTGGRLIVVVGCGGDRDPSKRAPMGQLAANLADAVVITSDNPRHEDPQDIADAMLSGVSAARRHATRVLLDRAEAIHHALEGARAGDVVLIAGKGHETEQVIGEVRHHFSDREAVEAWNLHR